MPATSVYLSNLFVILFSIAFCLPALPEEINPLGWFVTDAQKILVNSIAHLFAPPILAILLLVLPLGLSQSGKKDISIPKDREEVRLRLRDYSADGVSYSFERIWG